MIAAALFALAAVYAFGTVRSAEWSFENVACFLIGLASVVAAILLFGRAW